ncbi:hypothetical protein C8J57DRAFT_1537727 [Mycena rebaudengoi]|nr:hypothetical protein C8J57DRAFT_1537727 [Mycena rebaudengoi]
MSFSLEEDFSCLHLHASSPTHSASSSSEYHSTEEQVSGPKTPLRCSFTRLIPVVAKPSSDSRLYLYNSPTKTGTTTAWGEAAHATVGIPGASSIHLTPKSRKSQTKRGFAAFYGCLPGPYSSWEQAKAQVSGVSGAIHQGYSSMEAACAAFDYASAHSWIGARPFTLATPIPRHSFQMPRPRSTPEDEPGPLHHGTWYIVYKGINPGVYESNLECILHTVGIRGSIFDSTQDKASAFRRFHVASESGHTAVLPLV